ncbi:MAG: DegT/DnrJ/EryC1/StrS family aminotransferase [Candidatus Saccharimonadales bacterium]
MARINVTKTFIPPMEEYREYLYKIWSSGQLTNQGPLLHEFESKAKEYLGVDYFHFVTSGTVALQVALRGLGINNGEVITTPFSYVATTSAILWEKLNPIFVDIDPNTLCIDADKIEAAITTDTKAIMPVHVFGIPCDIDKIKVIAQKHNLKVIYDAAHAFGVKYRGGSLAKHGDISVLSFHATKLFHTIEGGGIIVNDKKLSETIELMKRFGHQNDDHYLLGINAKPSEFQAAMGLCNFNHIDSIIEQRKVVAELYDRLLGARVERPEIASDRIEYNYAYYPIILKSEEELLKVVSSLEEKDVSPRRYFYPSLNTLPYLKKQQHCPISEDVARRILCLPLYSDLALNDVEKISKIILESLI